MPTTTRPIAITVSVTDDGEPPLSASASFAITVRPKPFLQSVTTSGTNAILTWSSISGLKYRVQFKNDLPELLWQTLGQDVTATNTQATATDTGFGGAAERFYR